MLAVIFTVSTAALLTLSHQRTQFKRDLSLDQQGAALPYFNALVRNNSNLDSIARRMKKLPGVASVALGGFSSFKREIENLTQTFGKDILKGITSTHHQKIKVSLDTGLRAKSQKLIREYLVRLVGESSITLGNVKKPKGIQVKKDHPAILLLNKVDQYIYFIFGSLWLISMALLLKSVNRTSYIIEKFQRRRHTAVKILATGFISLLLPILALNIGFHNKFEVLTILTVGIMFVLLVPMAIMSGKKQYIRI